LGNCEYHFFFVVLFQDITPILSFRVESLHALPRKLLLATMMLSPSACRLGRTEIRILQVGMRHHPSGDRRLTTVVTNRSTAVKTNDKNLLFRSTSTPFRTTSSLASISSGTWSDKNNSWFSSRGTLRTTLSSASVPALLSSSSSTLRGSRYWKSTMASVDYDDDDDTCATPATTTFGVNDNKSRGHAEAAAARATSHLSHDESWMINLGRGNNNEWLLGPRHADDWFTGLKPTVCPGEYILCFLTTLYQ
jgi:hypothetical protein